METTVAITPLASYTRRLGRGRDETVALTPTELAIIRNGTERRLPIAGVTELRVTRSIGYASVRVVAGGAEPIRVTYFANRRQPQLLRDFRRLVELLHERVAELAPEAQCRGGSTGRFFGGSLVLAAGLVFLASAGTEALSFMLGFGAIGGVLGYFNYPRRYLPRQMPKRFLPENNDRFT